MDITQATKELTRTFEALRITDPLQQTATALLTYALIFEERINQLEERLKEIKEEIKR